MKVKAKIKKKSVMEDVKQDNRSNMKSPSV